MSNSTKNTQVLTPYPEPRFSPAGQKDGFIWFRRTELLEKDFTQKVDAEKKLAIANFKLERNKELAKKALGQIEEVEKRLKGLEGKAQEVEQMQKKIDELQAKIVKSNIANRVLLAYLQNQGYTIIAEHVRDDVYNVTVINPKTSSKQVITNVPKDQLN